MGIDAAGYQACVTNQGDTQSDTQRVFEGLSHRMIFIRAQWAPRRLLPQYQQHREIFQVHVPLSGMQGRGALLVGGLRAGSDSEQRAGPLA